VCYHHLQQKKIDSALAVDHETGCTFSAFLGGGGGGVLLSTSIKVKRDGFS